MVYKLIYIFQPFMTISRYINVRMQNIPNFVSINNMDAIQTSIIHINL